MGLLHLALIFSSLVFVLGTTSGHKTSTIAQPPTALAPAPAPHHHKGGGHHHHKHAPTPAPVHSPVKPPTQAPAPTPVKPPVKPVKPPVQPVKPPVQAPVKAPSHAPTPLPARKLVSVQGVVYCKPCNYTGVETLLGATPLLGAVVKLQCNNTKYPLVVQGKTDKNGYFTVNAPKKITTYGVHKCRVFVVSSPEKKCDKPTNLRYGVKGAILQKSTKPPVSTKNASAFEMFTVGPFAFEPSTKKPCSTH
ncbi:Pistil-specific extensin-like protein [Heracleum sosnowskyi]|uniref:Pistil-specific extensin-like protein n=1 Tax=Heracleum sosnowskyi TaxID=360622 RepID=A0AAD8HLT8_9APIA|nr:Pistil-specific extensin-like protein [Heracleum sosnowskyi]